MTWRLVLPVSLTGVVYAGLTIVGAIHGSEGYVALAALLFCGVTVGWRAPDRPVRHGLIAGFLAALWAVWLQAAFLPTYFDNNPGYENIPIPFGLDARIATFVLGPINALVAAAICALIAGIVGRLRPRSPSRPPGVAAARP